MKLRDQQKTVRLSEEQGASLAHEEPTGNYKLLLPPRLVRSGDKHFHEAEIKTFLQFFISNKQSGLRGDQAKGEKNIPMVQL